MKVLFVTADFYPDMGTTTNLLKKLFFDGGLLEKLDEIAVLSVKQAYMESDEQDIDGVHVYRAVSWHCMKKEELRAALRIHPLDVVRGLSVKLRERYTKSAGFYDKELTRTLCAALKRIHAEEFDVLVPVFGMYESVAAVMKFAGETAQRVVLYQVDPCSTNMTMTTDREMRLAFERRMYERASAVLTTDIICQEQRRLLPGELYRKFISMELPLVTEPKLTRREIFPKEGGPVCLFSGLIYSGIRDPGYTLRLFEPLLREGRAQLHFVGVNREDLPAEFNDLPVVCYGRQCLERAQELMNGADVLVNIGNLMTNQIPSKIFDYISFGKPIINVYKNRNCPTLPYLEKYPAALNLLEDDELLEHQRQILSEFLQTKQNIRVPFDQVAAQFADCTPPYVGEHVYKVLEDVVSKGSP